MITFLILYCVAVGLQICVYVLLKANTEVIRWALEKTAGSNRIDDYAMKSSLVWTCKSIIITSLAITLVASVATLLTTSMGIWSVFIAYLAVEIPRNVWKIMGEEEKALKVRIFQLMVLVFFAFIIMVLVNIVGKVTFWSVATAYIIPGLIIMIFTVIVIGVTIWQMKAAMEEEKYKDELRRWLTLR